MQCVLFIPDDNGVAGVVPTIELHHVVDPVPQEIGGFPFAFVAPLGADNYDRGHLFVSSRWTGRFGATLTTVALDPIAPEIMVRSTVREAHRYTKAVHNSGEQVVLVADDGSVIGVADKATVHTDQTPLHLAFSCHVRDDRGRILVTRRALTKSTWPGVWTNSFCGHPAPGEAIDEAIVRRAAHELGTRIRDVTLALPDFRYRAVDASGVVEFEICPVYTAIIDADLRPEPSEVVEWNWVDPERLLDAVTATPWAFSPWLTLQFPQLMNDGHRASPQR